MFSNNSMQAFFQILDPVASSNPSAFNKGDNNLAKLQQASSFLYQFAQSITVLEENHRRSEFHTTEVNNQDGVLHKIETRTATFYQEIEENNKGCKRDSGFVEELSATNTSTSPENDDEERIPHANGTSETDSVEETKGRQRMKERGRTMRIKDRQEVQKFLGTNNVAVRRAVSPNLMAKINFFESNGTEPPPETPPITPTTTEPPVLHRRLSRMNAVPLNTDEPVVETPQSPTIKVEPPPPPTSDEPKVVYRHREGDEESICSGGSGSYVDTNNVRRTLWGQGLQKSLWSDLPEVKESGLLDTLSPTERWLQEAMFEVMMSEAMYHHQLNVLVQHFMQCPRFSGPESILSKREKRQLFSDIVIVKKASEALLGDLEAQWLNEGVRISDVSDVLYAHATNNFDCYVKYCSNQVYQERMLKELRTQRPEFEEVLQRLESDQACLSLPLQSFLMLPIQRITRFPLLLSSIQKQLAPDSVLMKKCQRSLDQLKKVVQDCNEGARKMERLEEMLRVSNQLEFESDVHTVPIMTSSRFLLKQDRVDQVILPDSISKHTLRSISSQTLWFFVFNDLLVIAKRKGNTPSYTVQDYCPMSNVYVQELGCLSNMSQTLQILFYVSIMTNGGKVKEMVFSCQTEEERRQWISVLRTVNQQPLSPRGAPSST